MIRRSWTRAASIEETLALWAASLREVKKRIRPLFRQERVATNAGLFLEGLLGDEQRKTGWMRAEAAGDPGPMASAGDPGPHGLGCGCPARYRTRLCHRASSVLSLTFESQLVANMIHSRHEKRLDCT